MKTAYLGWESDNLQNAEVQALASISAPLVLHGFEISLSMMHGDNPGIGQSNIAVVLFQAVIVPAKPAGWAGGIKIGDVELHQVGGTNKANIGSNLGKTGTVTGGVFACTSFRLRAPGAANQILRGGEVDLAMPVDAGSWLALQAGHSGIQVDFECQAVLFYE